MKNFFTYALLVASPLALATKYELDPTHTNVGFEATHLGITTVPGSFKEFKGSFDFDEKTHTLKDLVVEIKTASVNTNDANRDKHLQSADFFEVEKYPTAVFKITKPVKLSGKPIDGELTMHGVTQTVPLKITFNGMANANGKNKVAFDAAGKVDRTKFGMTWNKEIEAQKPRGMASVTNAAKEWAVGTNIKLNINAEANQIAVAKK